MRPRTNGALILSILISLIIPCYVLAQDIKPPTCCNKEDPIPPQAPASSSLSVSTASAEMEMPQVTVSDAILLQLGLTRSQFLDRLAATMCPTADGGYDFVIPIYTMTATADGAPIMQVTFFQVAKTEVAPDVIDTLDLVFITNGETCVAVVFASDTATSK